MTMRATFYGGPADGGQLTLREPVRASIRFPLTLLEAVMLLEPTGEAACIPNQASVYHLELVDGHHAYRDPHGRLRYVYVPARRSTTTNPTPKDENHDPDPGTAD